MFEEIWLIVPIKSQASMEKQNEYLKMGREKNNAGGKKKSVSKKV